MQSPRDKNESKNYYLNEMDCNIRKDQNCNNHHHPHWIQDFSQLIAELTTLRSFFLYLHSLHKDLIHNGFAFGGCLVGIYFVERLANQLLCQNFMKLISSLATHGSCDSVRKQGEHFARKQDNTVLTQSVDAKKGGLVGCKKQSWEKIQVEECNWIATRTC